MISAALIARLRAFGRDRRGAAVLEFALVATPFFIMILAVFEYALVYLVTVSLDSATSEVARTIRTGEAQKAAMTATDFKTQVCAQMGWLANQCNTSLYVDARTFSTFAGETSPTPLANGTFNPAQLQFNVGGPGDIVLVTSYYQWKLLTPALTAGLSSMTGGIDVVTARDAFRNEPYT